jgi:hypothetical protein
MILTLYANAIGWHWYPISTLSNIDHFVDSIAIFRVLLPHSSLVFAARLI